jgi:hypothetical protein
LWKNTVHWYVDVHQDSYLDDDEDYGSDEGDDVDDHDDYGDGCIIMLMITMVMIMMMMMVMMMVCVQDITLCC